MAIIISYYNTISMIMLYVLSAPTLSPVTIVPLELVLELGLGIVYGPGSKLFC